MLSFTCMSHPASLSRTVWQTSSLLYRSYSWPRFPECCCFCWTLAFHLLDFLNPQLNMTAFLMSAASTSLGSVMHQLDIQWFEKCMCCWLGSCNSSLTLSTCLDTWMLMSLLSCFGSWATVEPPTDSLTLSLLIVLSFLATISSQFPRQEEMPLSSHLCFMMIWLVQKSNGDSSLPWYMSSLMVAWGIAFELAFRDFLHEALILITGLFAWWILGNAEQSRTHYVAHSQKHCTPNH